MPATANLLRNNAARYAQGRAALWVSLSYLGLVASIGLAATVGVFGASTAPATMALFAVTLPCSAPAVALGGSMLPSPGGAGVAALAADFAGVGLLAGAGAAQAWALWRLGRGERYW